MHYYIDGYNLLFRYPCSEDSLADQRQQLLETLEREAQALKLHITVVFDATQYSIPTLKSHYGSLEVLFSAPGQTADEAILEEIHRSSWHKPEKITVVTSDRKLASSARSLSAHTKSVEEFIRWINKSFRNKLTRHAKFKEQLSSKPMKKTSSPPLKKQKVPSPKHTVQESFDYYLFTFLERLKNPDLDDE